MINKKTYNFTCTTCHKNFTHLRNFKAHVKTHQPTSTSEHHKLKCPLCKYDCVKAEFFHHLESVHDLPISTETLNFSSSEEFILWKTNLEKQTSSSFIKKHGTKKNTNFSRTIYWCHRSGIYVPKGKGIRHLKTQGTCKIDGHCPAQLNVTSYADGKLEVIFTKTHVGHGSDLGHLKLTSNEKSEIAAQIAANVPFNAILDGIRNSLANCELDRMHLLTRKDLHNIKQYFILNCDTGRHTNDAISIKSIVDDNADSDDLDDNTDSGELQPMMTIKTISNTTETEQTLESEKEKFKVYCSQVLEDINSMEQLSVAKKIVASIPPAITALKKHYDQKCTFVLPAMQ